MAKPSKPAKRKVTWRDIPESAIPAYKVQPNPESLRPSEATMLRCISGMHEARAIIDSWAFRYPVTIVPVLND